MAVPAGMHIRNVNPLRIMEAGEYQVQIYVGREWANSGAFSVLGEAPTPTATVSPTYTITPSATITLSPTITTTPRDTAPAPRPSRIRHHALCRLRSRRRSQKTPTITPTPTITRTPRPTDTPGLRRRHNRVFLFKMLTPPDKAAFFVWYAAGRCSVGNPAASCLQTIV